MDKSDLPWCYFSSLRITFLLCHPHEAKSLPQKIVGVTPVELGELLKLITAENYLNTLKLCDNSTYFVLS
jgi:hypothetical protein